MDNSTQNNMDESAYQQQDGGDEVSSASVYSAPLGKDETPSSRPRLIGTRRLRRDIIETVLLVMVIYTLVNLTTARAIVDGPSMQPNFYTGQLVVINRFAYFFTSPQRGDVVVLHNPRPDCQDPAKIEEPGCEDLIKRVIGMPNETIEIIKGRVYVNGDEIDEPYVKDYCHSSCDGKWKIEAEQYLVLGDNRNNSYDGHNFGPIPRTLIVGQAWIRYWPLQDARLIPHPTYTTLTPTPDK